MINYFLALEKVKDLIWAGAEAEGAIHVLNFLKENNIQVTTRVNGRTSKDSQRDKEVDGIRKLTQEKI